MQANLWEDFNWRIHPRGLNKWRLPCAPLFEWGNSQFWETDWWIEGQSFCSRLEPVFSSSKVGFCCWQVSNRLFPALTTANKVSLYLVAALRPSDSFSYLFPTCLHLKWPSFITVCIWFISWKDNLRKIHSYMHQTCSLHIYIACNYIGGGGAWTQACWLAAWCFDH